MTNSSRRPLGRRFVVAAGAFLVWAGTFALTLFGLLVVTFALSLTSAADPALHKVGDHASEAVYQQARHDLGLDRPVLERFVGYVTGVAHGDLGTSWSSARPIAGDLARVFPATVELSTVAIFFGAVIGISLGVASALKPRGAVDNILRIVSLIGYSVPIFWLGLLLLLLFYAILHWAVGPGRLDDIVQYTITPVTGFALIDTLLSGDPTAFQNAVAHLVLPASVLAFFAIAGISRLTRAALFAELSKEYVVAARAKGATQWQIVVGQALPNVAGVVVTVVALSFTVLLEGAILTETVFAWPGIGRYITQSIFAADMPAILGATLVIGTTFVTVNAITDLLVRWLDPRVRA
jgi:peptide/nickel transport system permease protein